MLVQSGADNRRWRWRSNELTSIESNQLCVCVLCSRRRDDEYFHRLSLSLSLFLVFISFFLDLIVFIRRIGRRTNLHRNLLQDIDRVGSFYFPVEFDRTGGKKKAIVVGVESLSVAFIFYVVEFSFIDIYFHPLILCSTVNRILRDWTVTLRLSPTCSLHRVFKKGEGGRHSRSSHTSPFRAPRFPSGSTRFVFV